jgi:hypothetical protein
MGKIVAAAALAGACFTAVPVLAQGSVRQASDDVVVAFQSAVSDACIPAVSQGVRLAQIPQATRGAIGVARDEITRKKLGAAPEETVWSTTGKSSVAMRETFGRCIAEASDAPGGTAVLALADSLVAAGFEKLAQPARKSGPSVSLFRVDGKRRIQVLLETRDAGASARATVFATPAR